ncbi:MAG: DUF881 domain-containing protein [Armatimonadota bacterium]
MNGVFSHPAARTWLPSVTLMSLLLGALLAANLNTQGVLKNNLGLTGAGEGRVRFLVQSLKEQRDAIDFLKANNEKLNKQVEKYEVAAAEGNKATGILGRELQDLKLLAALSPVAGPGVVVTLDDNKKSSVLQPESDAYAAFPPNIVHDYDLRSFVSELFASGAEAVAINEHRIGARASIRCVGPVISINGEPSAPPFVIKAIGNAKELMTSLNMQNGVVDIARAEGVGPNVSVESSDRVELPAYSGAATFKYAKPLTSKG